MGMKGIYKIKKNPLPWVDGMLGVSHTNFFEQRVTDYSMKTHEVIASLVGIKELTLLCCLTLDGG